jgi:hypothetical protein
MVTKAQLKKKLRNLLKGESLGETLTIIYHNPATGEAEILFQSPAVKGLQIEVDGPATAETFIKLREHKT